MEILSVQPILTEDVLRSFSQIYKDDNAFITRNTITITEFDILSSITITI